MLTSFRLLCTLAALGIRFKVLTCATGVRSKARDGPRGVDGGGTSPRGEEMVALVRTSWRGGHPEP